MKFIRDLISEKANLAGRAAREQPTTDMVGTIAPDVVADPGQANDFPAGLAGPDVDIINKVASGGQALNNAAEYAFAAGEPTVSEPGIGVSAACKTPLTPASDYSETEDDNDGFDLTSDVAPLDLQDEGARDDPDELFGDLWTETSTDDAKPDPDLYDDGMAAPAAIAMPAVVSTPDVATFSEPGMAAEPVSAPPPKTGSTLGINAPGRNLDPARDTGNSFRRPSGTASRRASSCASRTISVSADHAARQASAVRHATTSGTARQ